MPRPLAAEAPLKTKTKVQLSTVVPAATRQGMMEVVRQRGTDMTTEVTKALDRHIRESKRRR